MKSSEAMIFAVMIFEVLNFISSYDLRSPQFLRLLYATAKIALITAKIIASLDIKTFFIEQRRYQKSKNPALNRVCVSIKFYSNIPHDKFFEMKLIYCLIILQRSYLCLYVRKTTHNFH